jgi:glyoxylase-like metal-dependent hydrolase (beta-lactamase superfamily II)
MAHTDLPYLKLETLTPLVRRVLARNPSVFTYSGTQTYIVGREDVAVIDPGPERGAAEHIEALLAGLQAELGHARVVAIVCTHTHRDHSPAAAALKAATGAPISGCAPITTDFTGFDPRLIGSFDTDYAPDKILADGELLHGADWSLEAMHTPGHASNHLCFALPQEQAIFSGDHVMGWSTSVIFPPDGDMGAYYSSLEKMLARAEELYYPTHGAPITNAKRVVRSHLNQRKMREAQIVRELEAASADIENLVYRLYPKVSGALNPAALGTVWAHLRELEKQGRVRQCGTQWQIKGGQPEAGESI